MSAATDVLAKDMDARNLKKINAAFDEKRIDVATRDYLTLLYSDGMGCFQQNFYFLGRTLGAPKTPIYKYNAETNSSSEKETEISEIGPNASYIVHHRFDKDPMRNQFFLFSGTTVRLFVSSIVSVIIASQKSVGRSIDKVTGKYYDEYLAEVVDAVAKVLTVHKKTASIAAISEKITSAFRATFVSNPAPEVLKIIGNIFPEISVDLVRALDLVLPPHIRLRDVYRMKLLFDTVPQINAFIENVRHIFGPGKILSVRNKFFDLANVRGYRDAKIVVGFDINGSIAPLEIICNVRTFFEAERQSHLEYETLRAEGTRRAEKAIGRLHHEGTVAYNTIIYRAAHYLLHRVGWNIIYDRDLRLDSFFRGFPEIKEIPYPQKIVNSILEKVDGNVQNEIFRLPYAPRPLSQQEEISVFRYIARFILSSALPYSWKFDELKGRGLSDQVFNFVMKELYRYYEHNVI